MNIPSKIKLGGFEITIRGIKDLVAERECLGEWHPRTQEIWIDSDHTDQQKEETLLHEVMEAICYIYNINIEHRDLSNIATVLHQVIKDNPNIFSTLEASTQEG